MKLALGIVTEIVQDLAYTLDSSVAVAVVGVEGFAVVGVEGFAAVAAGPSAVVAVVEAAA